MGCFLACFGGTKDRKQRRRPKKSLPTNRINENYQALLTSPSPQKSVIKVKADVVVPELRENKENQEQGSFDSCRKKVTFDLNIKTYENFKDPSEDEEVKELKQEVNEETEGKVKELKQEVKEETEGKVNPVSSYRYQNCDGSDDECIDDELEEELDEEVKELKQEIKEETEGKVNPVSNYRYQNCDGSDDECIDDELEEELDEEVKELKQEIKEETEGKVSPVSNYRYQNCDGSDNECIDDELEEELDDTDFEDEDDDIDVVVTEEESCESFFSLPMDKEKQLQCCQEADSPVPVSILDKGSMRDRSQYVHSVLNPVENLSQWKEVKARALPMKKLNKDNITSVTPKTSKSSNNENSNSESETKVISVDASKVSPVSNYRYQNCDGSDNECIDDELEEELDDTDFEDEDDDIDVVVTEEESCESFFSLPMDKEKQLQCCQEADSPVPVSILDKGSTRDRSQYVHSVLNPVENLSQWKEVKARALPMKKLNKDNITCVTPKTSKSSNNENSNSESETKVISVDASLSTWLVLSENSPKEEEPQRSNSSISREDKPVLGALTVEDLKPSVTSSPRTPSRNPDDIPILGTVGSYWSRDQNSDVKGIPNTTSKYREDKRVNWHSTPFEVRLERALNIGAAEA